MTALGSRYSAKELAQIIDFLARSYPICREETARLRAGATPAAQDARPAASER